MADKIAYYVLGETQAKAAVGERARNAAPLLDLLDRIDALERTVYGKTTAPVAKEAQAPAPAPAEKGHDESVPVPPPNQPPTPSPSSPKPGGARAEGRGHAVLIALRFGACASGRCSSVG